MDAVHIPGHHHINIPFAQVHPLHCSCFLSPSATIEREKERAHETYFECTLLPTIARCHHRSLPVLLLPPCFFLPVLQDERVGTFTMMEVK